VRLTGVQWRSDAPLCSGSPRRLGPSIDLTCLAAGWLDLFLFVGGFNDLCGESVRANHIFESPWLNLHVHSVPWLSPQAPPGHRSPPTATIHRTVHVCILSVFLSGPRASSRHCRLPLFHGVSTSGVCTLLCNRAWRGFFLAPDPHRQSAPRTRPRLGHLHP